MDNIINFEEYKNNKSLSDDDTYEHIYNYYYTLIEGNIDTIIGALESATNKDDFHEIVGKCANELVANYISYLKKEEIIEFIKHGVTDTLQTMAVESLSNYQAITDIYHNLRK